jgi:hypothetical protein
MIFSRRKRRPQASPSIADREAEAYLLLEQARILCERLRGRRRSDALDLLHRELGTAGYCASANLATARRRAALDLAHRRSHDRLRDGDRPEERLTRLIHSARRAVEHALIAPGLTDHMQRAHVHVLTALELLPAAAGRRARSTGSAPRQPSTA